MIKISLLGDIGNFELELKLVTINGGFYSAVEAKHYSHNLISRLYNDFAADYIYSHSTPRNHITLVVGFWEDAG